VRADGGNVRALRRKLAPLAPGRKKFLTGFRQLHDHEKMKSRWLLHLCFALSLLFAQQGAARHALAHLAENLPAQSQQEKHLPHSPACDKCVVYAGIGSAAASVAPSFDLRESGEPFFSTLFSPFFSKPQRAYSSRAPPPLA